MRRSFPKVNYKRRQRPFLLDRRANYIRENRIFIFDIVVYSEAAAEKFGTAITYSADYRTACTVCGRIIAAFFDFGKIRDEGTFKFER